MSSSAHTGTLTPPPRPPHPPFPGGRGRRLRRRTGRARTARAAAPDRPRPPAPAAPDRASRVHGPRRHPPRRRVVPGERPARRAHLDHQQPRDHVPGHVDGAPSLARRRREPPARRRRLEHRFEPVQRADETLGNHGTTARTRSSAGDPLTVTTENPPGTGPIKAQLDIMYIIDHRSMPPRSGATDTLDTPLRSLLRARAARRARHSRLPREREHRNPHAGHRAACTHVASQDHSRNGRSAEDAVPDAARRRP